MEQHRRHSEHASAQCINCLWTALGLRVGTASGVTLAYLILDNKKRWTTQSETPVKLRAMRQYLADFNNI